MLLCGLVSNAFWKSRYTTAVKFPLDIASTHLPEMLVVAGWLTVPQESLTVLSITGCEDYLSDSGLHKLANNRDQRDRTVVYYHFAVSLLEDLRYNCHFPLLCDFSKQNTLVELLCQRCCLLNCEFIHHYMI